jgi:hypothetical protein
VILVAAAVVLAGPTTKAEPVALGVLSSGVHLRSATGHYYVKIADRMKWNAANRFAGGYRVKYGGVLLEDWKLATITDAGENAFVFNVVLNQEFPGAQDEASFLGAIVRDGSITNFKWVTGEPFVYTNFAPSQPDVARENVIEMGGSWGAKWNNQDGPGSPQEESRAFILEHGPVRTDLSLNALK